MPVYYRKIVAPVEKPFTTPQADKGGFLSIFRKSKWLLDEHSRVDAADTPVYEYVYKLGGLDSKQHPDAGEKPPALTVNSFGVKYEMSQADLDTINSIKQTLHKRLSPILENHGLQFVYKSGGDPEETPIDFNGTINWRVVEKRYEQKFSKNRNNSLFLAEASVGKVIIKDSGKIYNRLPYVVFVVRLEQPSHLDHYKIPLGGIGAELFLEDLFAVLEENDFKNLSLPGCSERLDWFCRMIEKHQDVVLKPLSISILEAVFNSIRSRAIKVENME